MPIDLHTHSTASDGTFTPAGLVSLAAERGLEALALTDHDTVLGLAEAVAAGPEQGVEVVPGCELSVETGNFPLHIVGLFLPPQPERLMRAMDYLMARRHERNREIVDKLVRLGLDIDYEEVRALAGEGSVGRPHVARVLVEKRIVTSFKQAFDVYLGSRGKAYVPKVKLGPEEAIGLLKAEGATVILAHPYLLGLSVYELETEIKDLRELGLDGIEVYYPEHSTQQTRAYLSLARRLGLAVSGGSDFHGSVKPEIGLGTGRGGLSIPLSVLEELKAFRAARGLPS